MKHYENYKTNYWTEGLTFTKCKANIILRRNKCIIFYINTCLQYISGLSVYVMLQYTSIYFNTLPHLQTCWFYFSFFDLALRYWQEENHFSYLPGFSWEIDPFKKATCCDSNASSTYCNLRHASCVLKLTFLKLSVWG